MSLVITSNTPTNDVGSVSVGINRSFSYVNNFNDTLIIPKQAKIAVQSIKINKDSRFNISSINNKFSFFYGQVLNEDSDETNDNIYSFPMSTTLINPNDPDDPSFHISPEDLANVIEVAGRKALFHPNLLLSTNNASSFSVDVKRNASELSFEGYNFYLESTRSASNTSNIPATWKTTDSGFGEDATFNPATNTLTNNDVVNVQRSYLGTNYPLDLLGGVCEWEITKQKMRLGLTRNLREFDIEGNLMPPGTGAIVPWWFPSPEWPEDDYYDWVCDIEADFTMKIYYSTPSSDRSKLEMKEFDYRYMNGGDYFNVDQDDIEKVKFQVKNEQVSIILIDEDDEEYILTNGTSAISASNVKGVNMNTRFLYPKVTLASTDSIVLDEFEGVNITNWVYGDQKLNSNGEVESLYMDFFAYIMNNYQNPVKQIWRLAKDMDLKYGGAIDFSGLVGLDSLGLADYQPAIFTAPDTNYELTSEANTGLLFGFENRNPALNTEQAATIPYTFNWTSDVVPFTIDTQSLFVRVNNLTHETYNMSVSNYSKIIYHILPYYFEEATSFGYSAHPMVYVDLNNPEPLFINDLSVDIVKSDETLADELVGKTIVVFHIIA